MVSGAKAGVLHRETPFVELDALGQVNARARAPGRPFQRGRIYQGGNIHDFEAHAGAGGDRVLYVGDHIYGDMLRAKKSSVWRTAMILQELEHELTQIEVHKQRPRARSTSWSGSARASTRRSPTSS